jgi:malonate-semialdehyde dehydrogenase (acetylating)/methylmalonate-semialdehyde dehydrogenase
MVGEDDEFYDRFMEQLTDTIKRIRIGYGLDESVQMGPLRDPGKKKRVVGYIEKGMEEGARLLLDGRKFEVVGDYPHDSFLGPSIFDKVTPEMTIAKEEIFGPVMSVMRVNTLEEAIKLVNDCPFGNAAMLYTSSGKLARQFQYETEAGNIGINIGIAAPMAFFPFSGMRDSFYGDIHGQGRDAVQFFTEQKVVIERWF